VREERGKEQTKKRTKERAMVLWLKIFHITAMTIWFTGLFFLPRLLLLRAPAEGGEESGQMARLGSTLYFGVMAPAAAVTITLGIVLLAYGFHGAWLPAKLALVTAAVLLHLYLGQLLVSGHDAARRQRPLFYRTLNWIPLLLLLAIAALTAAKPAALPPLGGI